MSKSKKYSRIEVMLIIMITLQVISILDRAVELIHRFYQG